MQRNQAASIFWQHFNDLAAWLFFVLCFVDMDYLHAVFLAEFMPNPRALINYSKPINIACFYLQGCTATAPAFF